MAQVLPSNMDTKYKLLTVMQQIKKLKEWHQMQQQRLLLNNINSEETVSSVDFSNENLDNMQDGSLNQNIQIELFPNKISSEKRSQNVSIDEEPISVPKKSFEMLLEDKLLKENPSSTNDNNKPKFTFLKKGEGLARFRMTADDFKLNKRRKIQKNKNKQNIRKTTENVIKPCLGDIGKCERKIPSMIDNYVRNNRRCGENLKETTNLCRTENNCSDKNDGKDNDTYLKRLMARVNTCQHPFEECLSDLNELRITSAEDMENRVEKENSELKMFEMLEERANNSSFSSSSFMMAKLMDDSIKSTPIKSFDIYPNNTNKFTSNDVQFMGEPPEKTEFHEYFGTNKLGVICEEPSKLEATITNEPNLLLYASNIPENCHVKANFWKNFDKIQNNRVNISETNDGCKEESDICNKINCLNIENNKQNYTCYNTDKPISISTGSCCTCSECSCYEENSHFLSTSVSIVAEETTIYSPFKKCRTNNNVNSNNNNDDDDNIHGIHYHNTNQNKNINVDDKFEAENKSPYLTNRSVDLKITEDLSILERNEDNAVLKLLLRARLEELENEIEAFKNENCHLTKIRKEYENEYNKFLAEKKEFMNNLTAEHNKEIEMFDNEKKKFYREKQIFEKCIKETKNRPTKQERDEIKQLKESIINLKEEMNRKESRWGAAQARIRTQMKQLENHNATLKEEIEKLQKSASKKVSLTPLQKRKSNVNKPITDNGKNSVNAKNLPSPSDFSMNSNAICNQEYDEPHMDNFMLTSDRFKNQNYQYSNNGNQDKKMTDVSYTQYNTDIDPMILERYMYLQTMRIPDVNKSVHLAYSDNSFFKNNDSKELVENVSNASNDYTELNHPDGSREKVFSDGRKEIWYSNGNVKKISADEKINKLIYYNGDVKEILGDYEIIKYYYAQTKTWHTTYKDGYEIIEFANGQIEKRHKDGTVEVVYQNGISGTISPKGDEKWTYKDGSVVINDKKNGQKIILLPNNQKEIHTEDFKKREYPDGTVKIVYADGTQETRYCNGRVRLKDKHGILISDSETMQDIKP